MVSKKYASCRPANTHLMGERCDRRGGFLEGRPVGTERWQDDGVSYSPDCGVPGEGPHYVGVTGFLRGGENQGSAGLAS
jgi:hypothetical protein